MPWAARDGGRAERRPDAGAPYRTEQEPDGELAPEACGREAAETLLGPIAHGAGGGGETHLGDRQHQDEADQHQHDGGHAPEHVAVEADGEADRRDEQAERDERNRQPCGQRGRTVFVLRGGRAEHERQQRHHAGRQDGQDTGQEGERERHGA